MGAIMCMGVATANSILVISFAREKLAEHGDAVRAAIDAGFTRFRPVLMTALAMIIGMVPMALGAGRGRRAERAARPRGHRRPDAGDRRHPGFRSDCFFPVAFPQGWRRDAAAASGYIGGAREFGGVMLEKTDGVKTPAPDPATTPAHPPGSPKRGGRGTLVLLLCVALILGGIYYGIRVTHLG